MKTTVRFFLILLFCSMLFLLGACAELPHNSQKQPSYVISDGDSTSIGRGSESQKKDHPGESGVFLLPDGLDAFVARAVLADHAERSIDVQYYMFHQDTVGRLLIKELLAAADRGVRVRMLIDDMYGEDGDDTWSTLDSHSNMAVRLYNPFVRGHSKGLQFITQLKRVNHRMHSKTYTVDNQVSIVGGRNIGDEYFEADKTVAFTDRDAMTIGPVVADVSNQFDEYWNSKHSYPITSLLEGVEAKSALPGSLDTLRSELDKFYQQEKTLAYRNALQHSSLAHSLRNESVHFSFSKARIIHDSAEKMTKTNSNWKEQLLISQLAPYIQNAEEELIIVSPYFVPGQQGTDALCKLSHKGVHVRILTNSLASNDVAAVHTGYMRHRKELLRCGVELYELNEDITKEEGKRFTWLPSLGKSSLHAKVMSMDRKTAFVGSFNFDQRSLNINTEIGLLFHNPELATETAEHFDKHINKVAFRVELVKDEENTEFLNWTGINDGKEVVFRQEPYCGFWQRVKVNLMRVFPLDSML